MSYDAKCHALAEVFLSDFSIIGAGSRAKMEDELAQRIQDAIEDFLEEKGLES